MTLEQILQSNNRLIVDWIGNAFMAKIYHESDMIVGSGTGNTVQAAIDDLKTNLKGQ